MKRHTFRRMFGLLLTVAMIAGLLPFGSLSVAAADTETRFVRVNSMDDIIPNARYILVGEYTSPLDGNVSYHVMGKHNSQRDGYRSSYAETQNDTEYFKMAEDLSELTLFSYGSVDNHEALIFRMSPNNVDKGRYYLRVGDNQYLFGFSRRVSDGAIGHTFHSCLPVDTQSYGNYWWRVSVSESGQWQFVTQWQPSRAYEYQKIFFYGPYPLTSQQFRGNQVSTVGGGDWKDPNTIDNVGSDAETHVYLYREVCTHEASKVTYSPTVQASCNAAGMQANWYCAGCMQYYADEACTQLLKMVDAYTPALPHNYIDGICTGCGAAVYTSVFVPKGNESSVGSSDDGKKYIVVAKDGDQYYAMGPVVGDTVSAVPVTHTQGAIEISSAEAGILTFDYYNVFPYGYVTDGGLLTAYGDKILLRDPNRTGDQEPGPMGFWGDYDEEFGYARAETDGSYSYMVFVPADGDTPAHFRAQSEQVDNVTLYEEACKHVNRYEQPYVAPTCTKQGCIAYVYCEDCWNYYYPDNLLEPIDSEYGIPSFGIPATGHNWNEDDVCNHCGMRRPVYTEVTDFAALESLPEDAYYIFVGEYDGQTYVGALPPYNPFTADSDGDGTVDAAQIDEDSDGIPDYLNVDLDANGICDYLECYDEENGVWDEWRIYDLLWQLEEQYYYEILPLYTNAETVTPNADGSISVKGLDRPIEFQMMWLEDEAYRLENPDDPWAQSRAFFMPNYWIVANDMGLYYNHFHNVRQNGMESFNEAESMEFGHWVIGTNGTGDYYINNIYNAFYETDSLRLRVRTDTAGNKTVEFVNFGEWLMEENVPENVVSQEFFSIRLYAYTPDYVSTPHVHAFGNWEIGNDAEHVRSCTCGAIETAPHTMDGGIVTLEPTYTANGIKTYTCTSCGYAYVEAIPALPTVDKVVDTETGITIDAADPSVVLPADTQLVVEKLPADAIDPDLSVIGDGAVILQSYNISLKSGGVEIQPGGQVLVTVPAPAGIESYADIQVVYVDEYGNVIPCVTTINGDGTITFVTDHFSVYAVVGTPAPLPGDADGDGKVNNRDLGRLQQYINEWDVEIVWDTADLDGNGRINNRDLGLLQQLLNN